MNQSTMGRRRGVGTFSFIKLADVDPQNFKVGSALQTPFNDRGNGGCCKFWPSAETLQQSIGENLMSIIDKVVAAVTPPESDQARAEARQKALQQAQPDSWLAMVVKHHEQIEAAFDAVEKAKTIEQRRATQKWLAIILTGHAIAEEVTLYPALASHGEKARTELAYQEQSAAKGETAALEELDPLSEDYNDKLAHIRGAVEHHMYEEEDTWFPKLQKKASKDAMARLTRRYKEEFNRYVGDDSSASVIKAFKSSFDIETVTN